MTEEDKNKAWEAMPQQEKDYVLRTIEDWIDRRVETKIDPDGHARFRLKEEPCQPVNTLN